ncbi:MAG: hypothetical protein JWN45_2264 [Acidobacteriaceae bacterium]|nr:hypothetical protein [Acidobacteriaceae bacterium]
MAHSLHGLSQFICNLNEGALPISNCHPERLASGA